MKCIFNIESVDPLKTLRKEYNENRRQIPRGDFNIIRPEILIGIDKLATEK